MRGVVGANVIKAAGGFVVRIECRDEETYRRVIRKLRLIGVFIDSEKVNGHD